MVHKIVDIHTHNPSNNALTISSCGVHPWSTDEVSLPLAVDIFDGCDAIGEIGLDFCCSVSKAKQQELFESQLKIAESSDKIVVIHCVKGYNEVLSTLNRYALRCVIFHGFIGSRQLAQQILSRGYYLSFGERTFSSPKTIEALKVTPLDKLFLETDQSEIDIRYIYHQVSTILGINDADLITKIYENYKYILHI